MITATASVGGVTINASPGNPNPPFVNYVIPFSAAVSDGTTATSFGGAAYPPPGTTSKRADKMIREAVAAEVLSVTNLVIDPDDIYIPFS